MHPNKKPPTKMQIAPSVGGLLTVHYQQMI